MSEDIAIFQLNSKNLISSPRLEIVHHYLECFAFMIKRSQHARLVRLKGKTFQLGTDGDANLSNLRLV